LNISTELFNWSAPISSLLGKKSKNIQKLSKAGINTFLDALWIFPIRHYLEPETASFTNIKQLPWFKGTGKVISVNANEMRRVGRIRLALATVTAVVKDKHSGQILNLKWFNQYPSQVQKIKTLEEIIFFGEVTSYNGLPQIINPEITTNEKSQWRAEYPMINNTPGDFTQKIFLAIPANAWKLIPETLPIDLIKKNNLLARGEAFAAIHQSEKAEKARERLIYEEFFFEQIKILLRKRNYIKYPSPKIAIKETDLQKFCELFPYKLTTDQLSAINAIVSDLKKDVPMMRLIQGDVGCGKTSVAIVTALLMQKNKYQTAIMCPTETLAQQHYFTFYNLLKNTGVNVLLYLGQFKVKEKREALEKILSGEAHIIIGTHSLIQEKVQYKKLGLAIIDEQHKFGVDQRISLTEKTKGAHCLVMTATPIPRSLSLTQYGDLEISSIKTLPSTRAGQKTRIITPATYDKFLGFLKTRLTMKEQAFIVVPAIEENEEQDFHALETVYKKFITYYPEFVVGFMHGRLSTEEKNKTMQEFKKGEIHILIATSVIEVGIDVANATIMAIINPERFGLSSLHQLRGRVGRSTKQGFCFLVTDKKVYGDAMERLKVIENSHDGFVIAEEDLKIRGEGDLFGTAQSGIAGRKLANIVLHEDILFKVREDVLQLIALDPNILEKYTPFFPDLRHVLSTI
jgi:ATP-dependent DNA helicase RecG